MDWYGLFCCIGLWLCSIDGMNSINYATTWLKLKGVLA